MTPDLWCALAVLMCVSAGACAQSPEYLVPNRFDLPVGAAVTVAVHATTPAGELARPSPGQLSRFFIRVAGSQDNREALPEGGRIVLTQPGVTMLVADWQPVILTVEAGVFRDFLAAHIPKIDPGVVADGAAVRVRHLRSAKCILHVSAAGEQPPDAATGTSKSGQLAEIRSVFDPVTTPVGADMPVRVYVRGDSESRVLVRASNPGSGQGEEFLTNAKGMSDFTLSAAGAWRVEFQWAKALRDDPEADWEVFSGTLTFSTPQPQSGKPEERP